MLTAKQHTKHTVNTHLIWNKCTAFLWNSTLDAKKERKQRKIRQKNLAEGAGLSFPGLVYVSRALLGVRRIWSHSERHIQPIAPELDWRRALHHSCYPVTSGWRTPWWHHPWSSSLGRWKWMWCCCFPSPELAKTHAIQIIASLL